MIRQWQNKNDNDGFFSRRTRGGDTGFDEALKMTSKNATSSRRSRLLAFSTTLFGFCQILHSPLGISLALHKRYVTGYIDFT